MSAYFSIVVLIALFTPKLLVAHIRAYSLANTQLFYNVYLDVKKENPNDFNHCIKFSYLLFGWDPILMAPQQLIDSIKSHLNTHGYTKKVNLVYTLAYFSLLEAARFQYFCGYKLAASFHKKLTVTYNIYRILAINVAFIIFAIIFISSIFSVK